MDLSPTLAAGIIKTSLPNEGGSSVGIEVLTADVFLAELLSPFPHCLLQPPTNLQMTLHLIFCSFFSSASLKLLRAK